ncbi:MAG: signal peptide peptidase SppA [Candidatus Krumholzibacteria bacterium]|nr:signal peptide peptidase SppA [Candidatus Krumholzibacteria bacterium]
MKKALAFALAAAALLGFDASVTEAFVASPDSLARNTLAPVSAPLRSELTKGRFVSDVEGSAALYVNPAGLSARRASTALLHGTYWNDRVAELTLGAAAQNIGFGFTYTDDGMFTSRNYTLGLGTKLSEGLSIGSAFTWHRTSFARARSPFTVDLGFMMQPSRSVSIAGVWKNVNRPGFSGGAAIDPFSGTISRLDDYFVGGISLRPLGERITLSGQAEIADGRRPAWLFGGRVTLARGVELFGSYARDLAWGETDPYEEYTGGVSVWFGSTRTRAQGRSRADGNLDYARYSLSFEQTDAFVKRAVTHKPRYAEVTVGGDYLDEGGGFSFTGGSKNLHPLLRELESIRADADVKGLLLKVEPLGGGFIGPVNANIHEIRQAVLRVKEAGKPVVAYMSEGGSSAELYLASAANRIVTPRVGTVGVLGVSLELNRMKRLFEKLGIDFDHYTAGDYKSSFHTIYTDTTTAQQAEEIRSLVEESYRLIVDGIATGRGIPLERMKELADGRVFAPDELVKERLVDALGWEKDAKTELGTLAGAKRPGKLATESIGKRAYWTERWSAPPVVAIVGAYGSIMSGKSEKGIMQGTRTMGSETVVKQLEAASRCPGVRAIVFRVDSGGGSALASDEILEEIRRIQSEVKIPVIVSMGNIAGSGGYWISMYGDRVFADPFTITGSIGVVWFKPVLQRLYEKIGVTNEVFKEGEHVDALSSGRRMTDDETKMLGTYIDGMYSLFVDKVAEGRKLDPERVREIGGGRVYFGTQALEIKLVDEIGGLNDAVAFAAAKTGIEKDYRTVYYRAFPGFFGSLQIDAGPIGVARALGQLLRGGTLSGFDETITVF